MSQASLVASMVRAARAALDAHCVEAPSKTVSVKIRIHKDLRETVDFVRAVEEAGVDFITVHGRTRAQRSSEKVDLDAIRLVKSVARVPVIANGDVYGLDDAGRIAESTGVDGVMAARGLMENPGLFAGLDGCSWDVVESFVNEVVRRPLPLRLVQHHLSEMCAGGRGRGESGALLGRAQRAEMLGLGSMVELIDWLDGQARGLRRL